VTAPKRAFGLVLAAAIAAAPVSLLAWSQWGGPTRDFKAPSTGLAATWPEGGPRTLWSRALGDGYSAIVTDGGTLFTMYRPPKGLIATIVGKVTGGTADPEIVVALDAATGRTLWEHTYDAPILAGMGMEYGPGPHSTPLMLGDLVYAVGVTGKMHALDKRSGRVVWAHDLWGALGGEKHGRGYACSPIAYGSTLITALGGRGQAMAAFDQKTGAMVWKAGNFSLSPSSPLLITVDGQEQLVVFHSNGVAGLDPRTGTTLWNHPHQTQYGLNISTPVWGPDNLLLLSSAYTGGTRVLELKQAAGKTAVRELWFNNRMRIHIGNAMRLGDLVIGSSGDSGPGILTAVNVRTGEIAWQERGLARAVAVYGDGKLILLDEDGVLGLAYPDAKGLNLRSRAEVLTNRAWTIPTLVGTKLYLRDRVNIKALELS
jgi:outer membrane protein assembly factor BamB